MGNDLSLNMYYYAVPVHVLWKNFESVFVLCIKKLKSYKQLHALPVGYIALYVFVICSHRGSYHTGKGTPFPPFKIANTPGGVPTASPDTQNTS